MMITHTHKTPLDGSSQITAAAVGMRFLIIIV